MRQPHDEEFIDILRTYCGAAPGGMTMGEAVALLASSTLAVVEGYISDTPGYAGNVAIILHSGGPQCIEVVTWHNGKARRATAVEWTS